MTQSPAEFDSVGDQVRIVRLTDRDQKLKDLPPRGTLRWVTSRKAKVVAAVREGLLSFEEACDRYRLSEEEFRSWMNLLDRHGVRGLRATRLQDYRSPSEKDHEGERAGA